MSIEVSEGLLYFLKYPLLLLVYLFLACMFRAMVGSLPRRPDLAMPQAPPAPPEPRPSPPWPPLSEPAPPPPRSPRSTPVRPAVDVFASAPAASAFESAPVRPRVDAVAPTPAVTRGPWLEVVAGMDGPPGGFSLSGPLLFGRAADCTVRLPDPFVSSHHARLIPDPSGPLLEDLGSRNGTWIGEERLQDPVRLEDGEAFAVGDVTFRYHAS